jgi:DNA invertase Pin-like site-specific DNA recombinase
MKEKILELRKLGFSYSEIAEKLNCSKSTISYHCSKLETNDEKIKNNLKIKNKKQEKTNSFLLQTDKIDEVISLKKELKTYDEIREITKLSKNVIAKICRNYKLTKNRKFTNITDEIIENINTLYSELGSIRKVAKTIGLDRGTISKYLKLKKKQNSNRKKQLSKNVVEWRKRTKIKLIEYKGGECEKCGYKKCIDALEFHHKDPNKKDFTISGKSWSFERLKKEVDKCILVCANCHREIHFEIKIIPGSSEAEQTTKYDK